MDLVWSQADRGRGIPPTLFSSAAFGQAHMALISWARGSQP